MGVEVELVDLSRILSRLYKVWSCPRAKTADIVHENLAIGAGREDCRLTACAGDA